MMMIEKMCQKMQDWPCLLLHEISINSDHKTPASYCIVEHWYA